MSYLKDMFRFEFESDSSSSYLVIRDVEENKLQKLQIEMFEQNPNVNIVPLSLRIKNNEYMIFYNITSKITLGKLLKRKIFKKDEFLDLLISISKTILDCKNYYAYDKNFAIDEEIIYVNPANLEAAMIYIPINFQVSFKDVFVQFVKRLIDDLVRIDENEDLGFLHRIRIQLRKDIFSMQDFVNLLNAFRYKKDTGSDSDKEVSQKKIYPQNNNQNMINLQKNSIVGERDSSGDIKLSKTQTSQKAAINIPPSQSTNKLKDQKTNNIFIPGNIINSNQENKDKMLVYPKKSIYAAIVLQVLVLLIIVISLIGILKSQKQDFSILLGVAIILGAVDFLIMRNLFDSKKKIPSNKNDKQQYYVNRMENQSDSDFREKALRPKENYSNHVGNEYNLNRKLDRQISPVKDVRTELLCDNGKDDTVILKDTLNLPYLLSKNDGINMKIVINKNNFLIGRLKDEVDYEIKNSSVSKIHTEIIKRDGTYFIKDLNSSNGTYVNSERLKSNFEVEIKNHDIIRIANIEFEFYNV